MQQHIVGDPERFDDRGIRARDGEQAIVRNDDLRVDLFLEPADALICLDRSAAAFEGEWSGHHTNGERAERLGDVGYNRRGAGARAATFASGDEDHVAALEGGANFVFVCFGSGSTDVGIATGT